MLEGSVKTISRPVMDRIDPRGHLTGAVGEWGCRTLDRVGVSLSSSLPLLCTLRSEADPLFSSASSSRRRTKEGLRPSSTVDFSFNPKRARRPRQDLRTEDTQGEGKRARRDRVLWLEGAELGWRTSGAERTRGGRRTGEEEIVSIRLPPSFSPSILVVLVELNPQLSSQAHCQRIVSRQHLRTLSFLSPTRRRRSFSNNLLNRVAGRRCW